MNIKVKRTNKDAVIPVFAHDTDSGFDFFTVEDTFIEAGKKAILKTGLILDIPNGWGIQIKNKSGITIKGCPIVPINMIVKKDYVLIDTIDKADITVFEGTIDMSYRGEIGIMVKNEEDFDITIPKHTKIAQGVLREVYHCTFEEVEEIEINTDRGANGYGSSGMTI